MFNPSFAMFIGLNPSTADETKDDQTIRKCVGFAKQFGFGALCMTNLFAVRTKDPAIMKATAEPIGPENDHWLLTCAKRADLVIAAWGLDGAFMGRDREVRIMLSQFTMLKCLKHTKGGHPGHPLYLSGKSQLLDWPAHSLTS